MNALISFLKDCKVELVERVTWPKFSDARKTSALVLVASFIFAVVIAMMDYVIDNGLDAFYQAF
jgi:preprotein translocase subunit SecE